MDHEIPTITEVPIAFEDQRGKIVNILDREGIEHVAIIGSKKGSKRGSHYHPTDWQYIYMVRGLMACWYQHVETGEMHTGEVKAGQLEYVPPGWAHTYQFLEDSVFLNITPGERSDEHFEEHTIKYSIPLS
jgi:dTDP-4-dehydrorhamnose 3,5-epimerase-like enzyme